jgi:hypothetical protein
VVLLYKDIHLTGKVVAYEALNEVDPGSPDVLKYVYMVRKRAGIPDCKY